MAPITMPPHDSPVIRKHFDERLTTRISSIQSFQSQPEDVDFQKVSRNTQNGHGDTEDVMQWLKLKKLGGSIYNEEFRIEHGEPTCAAYANIVAIGMSKGCIAICDQRQNITAILGTGPVASQIGQVVSVQLSADTTFLAAGYSSGTILLWQLSKPSRPALIIKPQQPGSNGDGHKENSAVLQIQFLGKRHTGLISSDSHGELVYHNGYSNLLGLQCNSRSIISGESTSNESIILQCSVLPLGTSIQPTDGTGVVALCTVSSVVVMSTHPYVRIHAKIKRPQSSSLDLKPTACVAWLPALREANGQSSRALLAYCFSKTLHVVELATETFVDKEGHDSLDLRLEHHRRWEGQEAIVSVNWVNSRLLALLTTSSQIVFLDRSKMNVAAVVDCVSRHIKPLSVSLGHGGVLHDYYYSAFQVYKGKIFVLGKYDFYLGTLENWADNLMMLLREGDYIGALEVASKQYSGECDLAIRGLPKSAEQRHLLVTPHIKGIIAASTDHIFVDHPVGLDSSNQFYHKFLSTALQTLIAMNSEPADYEHMFEKYAENGLEAIFYDVLEAYILDGKVVSLAPTILKGLVETYIAQGKTLVLEEIICLLDIRTLDIDLTISLCKKHGLKDILIYIWNVLLNDYISPLMDLMKESSQVTNASERDIYSYIGYILTGRQYPTEKPMDYRKEYSAKRSLYYILLNGTAVSWPENSPKVHMTEDLTNEPAFPYFCFLLKLDCFSMLGALNEAFEDTSLNDDDEGDEEKLLNFDVMGMNLVKNSAFKVTRQYVVDILLGVFRSNEFSKEDHFYLGIFIARNFPKYYQFLRISDSVLQDVIKKLCFPPVKNLQEEAEFALRSLLSVYHPPSIDELGSLFESSGYYRVLFTVYRSEKKMLKFLQLWNKLSSIGMSELLPTEIFKSTSELLTNCFEIVKSDNREEQSVIEFVKEHFKSFLNEDPEALAAVLNQYAPGLHNECTSEEVSDEKKYEYLRYLFGLEKLSKLTQPLPLELKKLYVKLLAKFDHNALTEEVLGGRFKDIDLDEVASNLRAAGATKAVVQLYVINSKPKEAVKLILQLMESKGNELVIAQDERSIKAIEGELFDDLRQGILLSKNLTTERVKGSTGQTLTPVEKMLLRFLEVPVKIFKSAHEDAPGVALQVAQRLMQEAFVSLIDLYYNSVGPSDEETEGSFLRIFSEFLNRSSAKVTTLGDVRQVVKSVYAAYSYEREIIRHVLILVNGDIFIDMEHLNRLNSSGWTTKNSECEICGKKLWGHGLNREVYELWAENRTGGDAKVDNVEDGDHNLRSSIISFKCGHGYHRSCLREMGSSHCIIDQSE
ncbi:unnamed protein product [Kuraishia capsulata CBS 1993]|uniref:Uncharacterized protein n=1 Tax=Kuraishia capsulata CBS 1993 TaxID=1382522 RepID=W6MT65_9ASCO|nr:uncharacterized protein KUCA_T00005928001 [Kuraishia capsulata CBS 1993]CDK29934.1 unnamed protein product [Kuraishia capsulata CBS 1993]